MVRRRKSPITQRDRIDRNYYNLNTFCLDKKWKVKFAGYYGMPVLKPCHIVPTELFPFDERNKWRPGDGAIQFFCNDCEFENVWLRANRHPHYPAVVGRSGITLTPDFSLFTNFPIAVQIWNTYRTRLLGAIWQRMGIDVVPCVSWGLPSSFEFCFDGLPKGGTLAIATTYIAMPQEKQLFIAGFKEMIRRTNPSTVLVYGRGLKGEMESLHPDVRRFDSRTTQIAKSAKLKEAQTVGNL